MSFKISIACMLLIAPSLAAQQSVDGRLYQDMQWRNIGPYRGGRSVAVAGVAQDPLTYYFGGVGSGVWKTTDAGQSWRNASDSTFGTASVGAVAVAPSDPNVVYVGMGEHAVRGVMTSHGDGVYRSTDAGRTWTKLGLDRTRHISAIIVHPANPDLVYVAAQGAVHGPTDERGVYRSNDGGKTWGKQLFVNQTTGASSLSMDPNNPRVLYAGMWDHLREPWLVRSGGPGSGIYRSGDGGDTWKKIEQGLPKLMGKTSVSVSASSDRIYALIEADPGGGVYRSDDGGKTWRNVNENWTLRARAWYYIHIHADPQNPDVVWVLNAPVMKSIDGGRSFTRVRTPHGDNHALWINPADTKYMINGNDGGANVSLNSGESWSAQDNQPTAQFYRVNVDNRFPYWVYGGQQDNSSVAIKAFTSGGGIGWKDWYASAGCESAYIAFHPDDPRLQYGGCYMGQISEFDETLEMDRNVMAYPFLPAALASRDMKYRFNWNAPIVVSRHDPSVIYHAGNVVLRSRDRGRSWTEVSPDLTRDDDTKQGPGGAPITNEGAGGEIYNTIMYLAESPHDANVLWAGSDDGRVHVTRDGGQTWQNVTPRNLPEGIVNAIDVSPHEPAAAYIAFTRYKFNDFTPHVYKTTNFGQSWTRVVDGIKPEAHVRVVREDPKRRGLLYAGTETGLYVSFDDGGNWQSFQLNMPVTPITDLIVQRRHNDLVAATQGRSFWILDDLSPLQQASREVAARPLHLYAPRTAYRVAGGSGFSFGGGTAGQNPPPGVIVDLWASAVSDSQPVTLEVIDEAGRVIRRYASTKSEGVDSASVMKLKAGHTRVSWDLRVEPVKNVEGLYVWGSLRGYRVPPGDYRLRASQGEASVEQRVTVLVDPRVSVAATDFIAQADLAESVSGELQALHDAVTRMRSTKAQIDDITKRVKDRSDTDSLRAVGAALVEKLTALEDSLVQKRTVDGQTVINFTTRLRFQYVYLRGAIDEGEGRVTEGMRELARDLSSKWTGYRAQVAQLLGAELERFNVMVREAGVPAVVLPRTEAVSTTSGAGAS